MHRPRLLARATLGAGALVATLLEPALAAGATTSTTANEPIALTTTACAPGWGPQRAGRHTFVIDNRTEYSAAIYLFNPFTGVTIVERKMLQPESKVTLAVTLKPGNYTWGCHLHGVTTHQSRNVRVRPVPVMTAAGPATPIPVAPMQLAGPVERYRTYVRSHLVLLVTQTATLRSAIAGGQVSQAEGAWLTAHLTWQRVGAAYDAFGTLGTKINGLSPGQDVGQSPGTPSSTSFEGFHKIELDLWGHGNLAAAGSDADQLAMNLSTLVARFARDTIPPDELPLRTHEILEDSQRDELSGDDDYGSGTDMASVEEDVSGTEVLLQLLAPLLKERAPELVQRATVQLQRLDVALTATQQGGRWVAVGDVPLDQREQVEAAMGAALEILAIVPDIMPVAGSTL